MEKERAHEHAPAGRYRAHLFRHLLTQHGNLRLGETAEPMGARQHAEGTVAGRRIVEVQAYRENVLQQRHRRLDVDHTLFDRPRTEAVEIAPLTDRDGEILMPGDFPVGSRRLIENGELGGPGVVAEQRSCHLSWSTESRELSQQRGLLQDVANTATLR